jgi:large subunit ribosomal protein L2
MIIKLFKPYTNTTRHKSSINYINISKKKPEKSLIIYNYQHKGRNNQGKITSRHKGGGHKKKFRIIDFIRNKYDILGKVVSIEYDPYRNANISLINYIDGEKRYILHPENLKIGNFIISTQTICNFQVGNNLLLANIPNGTEIHNLELFPNKGGQLIRSAGNSAIILTKEKNFVIIRLASKEIRLFNQNCRATIGKISNEDYYRLKLGKAGRSRWLGIRPHVRGSAMNPIDHPHGGGTGKTSIGKKNPKTPWGKITLGLKTRKKKNKSNIFIIKNNKKLN